MKTKNLFICQQCAGEFPKWFGRCPNCGEWNSLVETRQISAKKTKSAHSSAISPIKLNTITQIQTPRFPTGFDEIDRTLGGGLVPGMVVLLAGEPGIGKSTLLLQIAQKFHQSVLYVSGEESAVQIKIRADRLGLSSENIELLNLADTDQIISHLLTRKAVLPGLVIVDSIQTLTTDDLSGTAGSVGQVRECAARLTRLAKEQALPLIIVGHVTREGTIAGPKVLEHIVDTVLYLEGEKYQNLRLLRAQKNRFGSVDELGVFEMSEKGMIEVINPSSAFLTEAVENTPGAVIASILEGSRPLLVEIEALTTPTTLPIPRRIGAGIDSNRVSLLSAVLTKKLNLKLASQDIYIKISGGLKVREPAVDLGVALSIVSSLKDKPLPPRTVAIGEVGLLGEIRNVTRLETRIKEAKRLGFTNVISSQKQKNLLEAVKSCF